MKGLVTGACAAALIAITPLAADEGELSPQGSRTSLVAPADYFTGPVVVDPLFGTRELLPSSGAYVTFAPGARSAWHSHPAGQMMIITSGAGWVQEEGGEKREVRAGDVIWTPPGVKHWHGATATSSMRHMVITNMRDGKNVTWMEQVSDAQYGE